MSKPYWGNLISLLAAFFLLPAFAQDDLLEGPKDLRVAAYEEAKANVKREVEKDVAEEQKFKDKEKEIEALRTPLPLRKKMTVKLTANVRRKKEITGYLRKIDMKAQRATIGDTPVPFAAMEKMDRIRFEAHGKPALLNTKIAELKAELKKDMEDAVRLKTDAKLKAEMGYTDEFFNKTVIMAGRFWYRKDLGHENVAVAVRMYGPGADHMGNFIEVDMVTGTNEPLACVLVVKTAEGQEISVCGIAEKDASGRLKETKWKNKRFIITQEQLGISGKDFITQLRDNSKIWVMKRHVGMWALKPGGVVPRPKVTGVTSVTCPECWGKKIAPPLPPVDVSEKAMAFLKEAQASDVIVAKAKAIIREYQTPNVDKEETECTTCEGQGTVKLESRRPAKVYLIPHIKYHLDEESIRPFNETTSKAFSNLYAAVPKSEGVDKKKEEIAAQIKQRRIQKVEKVAMERIEDLLAGWVVKYRRRKHEIVEKNYDWFTRNEMLNRATGKPTRDKCQFGGDENAGYVPTKVLGEPVRRYTAWKTFKIKKFGGMMQGYDVALAYYRILEVGGDPIKESEEIKSTTPEKRPRNRPGRPPSGFEGGPEGLYPPGARPMPGRPNTNRRTEEDEEEEKEKVISEEVPDDITRRQYVLQYAVRFVGTLGKKYDIETSLKAEFEKPENADQEIKFPLSDTEKFLETGHRFHVEDNWSGELIGSAKMSFSQLSAGINPRSLRLDVKVKVTQK